MILSSSTIMHLCFDIVHHVSFTSSAVCWSAPHVYSWHVPELSCTLQAVDAITATVDAPVLERLAKILAYTRVAGAGKPGKRLKRKDKLRMLEVLDAQNTEHAAVHASDGLANGANGAVQAPQPPSANGKAK